MLRFCVLCGLLLFVSDLNADERVTMRTIAQGGFSGLQTPTQLVVTNSSQWQELWKKHSAQRAPKEGGVPEINFEKESILFVAAGQKRSGGYRLEITELKQVEGRSEVIVKMRGPKPGGIQIQALTAPFHIVAVPKLTGPVQFKSEVGNSEAQ